jgi:hypothetical protein
MPIKTYSIQISINYPRGHDTPESNACKKDKVEDTKGANRNSTSKKDRKYKDQKDTQ